MSRLMRSCMAPTTIRDRLVTNKPLFIDTWGWTAMSHRREPRFSEIARYYQEIRSKQVPTYTSDYVLDEFISLIFARETYNYARQFMEAVLASVEGGQLNIERVSPSRFHAAWELRKRFQDKPRISFTDLTS